MWDSLRAAAIAITPDMSSPSLVRLFLAKLQARVSANARRGSKRDTARCHTRHNNQRGAETHFRLTIWESLRAAARAITPDMSPL